MIFHPGAHFQIRAHIHAAYRTAASAWDLPSATKTSYRKEFTDNYELKKIETFLKCRTVIEYGVLDECDKFCR